MDDNNITLRLIPLNVLDDLIDQMERDIKTLEIEIELLERKTLLECDLIDVVLRFEDEEIKRMEIDEKTRLLSELKDIKDRYENRNKKDQRITAKN